MLEVIRGKDGVIKGVCEFVVMNDEGEMAVDGTWMFIGDLEVAPEYRSNGVIKQIIRNILDRCPNAQKCGWVREYKYKGRPMRTYTRKQFEKLIKEA